MCHKNPALLVLVVLARAGCNGSSARNTGTLSCSIRHDNAENKEGFMVDNFCEAVAQFAPQLTADTQALADTLTLALAARMQHINPKRYAHCLSVAKTAAYMAAVYAHPQNAQVNDSSLSVDNAYIAGLLHDWDKILSPQEQIAKAHRYSITLEGTDDQTYQLLHGMTAARELKERYPMLSDKILHAIYYHTVACEAMNALDMVVFVADGIEPNRTSVPAIERTRAMVGVDSMRDVFINAFTSGIIYVLETKRYVYPPSIALYNSFVQHA